MDKTLQDLEAGDLAYIESHHENGIVKIDRITKTQIITTDGSKYRRRDGGLIGAAPHNYEYIKILTAEKKEIILRLRIKAKKMISNIKISTDIKSLEKLIIAIEPFVPEDAK